MFFEKKRKANVYAIVVVVVVAVVLILLGYNLLHNVLFPMLISAIWGLFLDALKNVLKRKIFSEE